MSIQKIKQESLDFGLTGAVAFFGLNTAPAGWLKANGALVSRTTYASLFAVIGTTYGAGDSSTTFALPDMRGEFPRGWDDGRAVDSGRAFGSAQSSQNLSHVHRIRVQNNGTASPFYFWSVGALPTGDGRTWTEDAFAGYGGDPDGGTAIRPDGGTEARSRNIALLACIKF